MGASRQRRQRGVVGQPVKSGRYMRLREVQLRRLAEVAGGSEDIDALALDV